MSFKDWVEVFNALLTPVIAGIAVYIAYQQHLVNKHALRNQLYERRNSVFKSSMSYLADIMREGSTDFHRAGQFYAETSEAEFLFSEVISNHMEELYSKGIDLVGLQEQLYPSDSSLGLPVGEKRSAIAKEKGELLKWFYHQIKTTKDMFRKEMRVG